MFTVARVFVLSAFCLQWVGKAQAVDVTNAAEKYDYIIVGGGTSGCVVAGRLSEDPDVSVLIIEAGPILDGDEELQNVLGRPTFENKDAAAEAYLWPNISTEPNEGLNGRTGRMSLARIAGGGSAVNGKLWGRGSKRDHDDWARYLDDDEWSWDNLLPYFIKSEKFTPPTESYSTQGNVTWDMKVHGRDGPISTAYPPEFFPSTKYVVAAERSLGIPQKEDYGGGDPVGAIWHPISANELTYTRSYSKNSYYDPVRGRKNLHFLADTTVTKILFDGSTTIGVEYAKGRDAQVRSVKVIREVIVAAGPAKSPQLLQVSGVGPQGLSEAIGVIPVANIPVGENLQDHASIRLTYDLNVTFDERMFTLRDNKTWWDEQRKRYIEEGKGWLTATSDNHIALLSAPMLHGDAIHSRLQKHQSPPQSLRSQMDEKSAEAYDRQHRILIESFGTNEQAVDENSYLATRTILVKPLSRGYVRAKTANIWDPPAINFQTFSHPLDFENLLASLRHARRVLATPEMAPLSPVETKPGLDVQSDEDLAAFIRENMIPGGAHGCCAAPMGTVLDAQMRVRGVEGLRVVDTSSWPMIPGAHAMQCTVYAVAEKAADLIKSS